MKEDRHRWNEKYETEAYPTTPSDIVSGFYGRAPAGTALDIAAGAGRNALFLAQKGFRVDAVDFSDFAIDRLTGLHPHITPIQADLDVYTIAETRYTLIVNVNYLNRRLFPYIIEGLVRGGVLIFETYVRAPAEDARQPSNRDYLLRENELLHAFISLKILFYHETKKQDDADFAYTASLVAVNSR